MLLPCVAGMLPAEGVSETAALTSQWIIEQINRQGGSGEPPGTVNQFLDSHFVIFSRLTYIIYLFYYYLISFLMSIENAFKKGNIYELQGNIINNLINNTI